MGDMAHPKQAIVCWVRSLRAGGLVVVLLLAAGCQQQMAKQPYYRPLEPSAFFADGRSARPLVPGTVARGHLRTDANLFTGKENAPPREARAEPRPGPDREKARA